MSGRIEFSDATKRTIALRAGYRCSFPGCGMQTSGPASNSAAALVVGDAAHIFAASVGGPRARPDLSEADLGSVENGIWLCRNHHAQVDLERGRLFPESALLSYRARHETFVAREIGAWDSPFGWVEELRVRSNPLGWTDRRLFLGKLTLLTGAHGAGKSLICRYLAAEASAESDPGISYAGFKTRRHEFELCYRDGASIHRVEIDIDESDYRVRLDGVPRVFNPAPFAVVALLQLQRRDLIDRVPRVSALSSQSVLTALTQVPVTIGDSSWRLLLSMDGELAFRAEASGETRSAASLSGGEEQMVRLQWAVTLAELASRDRPTLLVLDDALHGLDASNRNRWIELLSSADRRCQTILVDVRGARDLGWRGWQSVSV